MPKQFLIGGSILALLCAGSLSAQARTFEPTLLSQVQEEPSSTPVPGCSTTSPGSDGSMTSPAPDTTVTPAPDGSITTPVPDGSITTPAPDSLTTTPVPDDSTISPGADDAMTSPDSDGSNTGACESISQARPTGGATREKLQHTQLCNKGV